MSNEIQDVDDFYCEGDTAWIRKFGITNPDFWVLQRDENGDVQRVASTSNHEMALQILDMIKS